MAKMSLIEERTSCVTNYNGRYGGLMDAFDKICQITFDRLSAIDVYVAHGTIVIVGPVIDKNIFYPIEILQHELWDEISPHISIILKQFTIIASDEINCAIAAYFINRFGRISIADCMLVAQIVDPTRNRYAWLGHGCAFTGNI